MRRTSASLAAVVIAVQLLAPLSPARAAVNIGDYRSAAISDLDNLVQYYDSDATWLESTIRGIESPQGVLSYYYVLVDDSDNMAHAKYNETWPGDSLPAKATITYWGQACQYLRYMLSDDAQWDPKLDAFGAINIKLRDAFKDYMALEDERMKKDPNYDSRHAWYMGSNSEREPGFFLSRAFAMTMGYVKLYDRNLFVVGEDGAAYGPNNPCIAGSVDMAVVFYASRGNILPDKVIPWGRGPLQSEVRELGKQDAIAASQPTDSLCWYSLNAEERAAGADEFACQPAIKTTFVGSPSGEGDLNFIAYLKSYANTLVQARQYWREELAKLQAQPATNPNPIKGNVGNSVISLPLPLSNISVAGVIGRVINALLGIVGAVALLMFVWGGIRWMTAAGNQDQIGKAKQSITWAALGLIAIFSSYAILNFVIEALK